MGGKGSGRKKVEKAVVQEEVASEETPGRSNSIKGGPIDTPVISHSPGMFADEERQSFINGYLDEQEAEGITEESGEEPVEPHEAAEAQPEIEPGEEKADVQPEKEPSEYKAEEKEGGEEKRQFDSKDTINKGAFYEERDKRKQAQDESKGLRAEIDTLTAQLSELSQEMTKSQKVEEDEYLTKEEKQMAAMRTELDELKRVNTTRSDEENKTRIARQETELDNDIARVSDELKAEGYPGFNFMKDEVSRELIGLVDRNPDNAQFQNPEGWKKVYRELVYPRVSGEFAKQEKDSLFAEKNALKEKANLVTSPGKGDKPPENDDDKPMSFSDFTGMRSGFGAS